VNTLDVLVILTAVMAAVGGYRLGFFARVTSWLGLAVGVLAASLLLPTVLRQLEDASDAALLLVAVSLLVGAALIGQAAGLVLGAQLRLALPPGGLRTADQVAGAIAAVAGVFVALWLLLPTLGDIPGWTAEQARASTIAREVDERFPPAPNAIQALRRLVGDDPFPPVFDQLQPAPDPGPPPASTGLTQATADSVRASVVKVGGEACSRIQEGSGFFVADSLVATNAHVVAGQDQTAIELSDGSRADATVVAFDPARDLALLRTSVGRPVLPLGEGQVGDTGGVFGHPGGGPLEISPFNVSDRVNARGRDIYDRAPAERQVLVLASNLAPGDSGSALVNPNGQVIGVAFAVAPDRDDVAYALTVGELRAVLASDLSTPRDTGPCLV
jgi:S1-C subfamily serine protease